MWPSSRVWSFFTTSRCMSFLRYLSDQVRFDRSHIWIEIHAWLSQKLLDPISIPYFGVLQASINKLSPAKQVLSGERVPWNQAVLSIMSPSKYWHNAPTTKILWFNLQAVVFQWNSLKKWQTSSNDKNLYIWIKILSRGDPWERRNKEFLLYPMFELASRQRMTVKTR